MIRRTAHVLGDLLKRAAPDVPMEFVHSLSHTALVARGADAWMGRLGGHRVQRYSLGGKGSGVPVLLLHGLNAGSGSMATLLPALKSVSSRIAFMDLPSHGRSPHPEGPELSLGDYGKVAVQAAEELSQETGRKVALVGNSLGGALAFFVAQSRPDLVAGVVGLNPAGAPVTERSVADLPTTFRTLLEGSSQMAGLLFFNVPLVYWLVGKDIARGWTSGPVQKLLADARGGKLAPLVGDMLSKVTARTLILWGAEDKLLPYSSAEELRHLLPNARVEIVPGAGHILQLERPRWTAKRVAAFVGEL